MLKVDDNVRRPYDQPRVVLNGDVHDDLLPHGTHLTAAEPPGVPGALYLPALVGMRSELYPGQGCWNMDISWYWQPLGPERPGHDPSCRYCVHGPACVVCPPAPYEVGPLTVCGPCGREAVSSELRFQVAVEEAVAAMHQPGRRRRVRPGARVLKEGGDGGSRSRLAADRGECRREQRPAGDRLR